MQLIRRERQWHCFALKSWLKVNPFNSHKQICTPRPLVGERLGLQSAETHTDKEGLTQSRVSKYCKQWLYSSVTVMKPRPRRPRETNEAELSASDKQEYTVEVRPDNSLLFFVKEKSTQTVFFMVPTLGFSTRKSGRADGTCSVFVWCNRFQSSRGYCLK